MGKVYYLNVELKVQLAALHARRFRLEDKFMQLREDMYELRAELALIDHNIEEILERLKAHD